VERRSLKLTPSFRSQFKQVKGTALPSTNSFLGLALVKSVAPLRTMFNVSQTCSILRSAVAEHSCRRSSSTT
jgi:hypothetical protein